MNQNESDALARAFHEQGYTVTDADSGPAEVVIINTCAVTTAAARKSRQAARHARDLNPSATIVLVGCLPQVDSDALAATGADIVVGTQDKSRIPEIVARYTRGAGPLMAVSRFAEGTEFDELGPEVETSRTRATVKIQDGCQQFCSYCIIPYARGPERSRSPEQVHNAVERAVANGFREVVLAGIHVGAYGRDLTSTPTNLGALLERLLDVPGLKRLRLSSIEPTDVTDEIIRLMGERENFCHHLHIPLQSGCDETLKRMHRKYTTSEYAEVVERVRSAVPDAGITTDLIVGFPGETEAEFEQTMAFVANMRFSRMHIFRYSRRPGTPAATMPDQVPDREKTDRGHQAAALAARMAESFHQTLVGKTYEVLVEEPAHGLLEGYTGPYARVRFNGPETLVGSIVTVKGERAGATGVKAEIVDKPNV